MKDNQAMRDFIQREIKVAEDWKVSKRFMMKHGSNNNRINKGSMEKRKPERINITQKGNRKSNEKGRSNSII